MKSQFDTWDGSRITLPAVTFICNNSSKVPIDCKLLMLHRIVHRIDGCGEIGSALFWEDIAEMTLNTKLWPNRKEYFERALEYPFQCLPKGETLKLGEYELLREGPGWYRAILRDEAELKFDSFTSRIQGYRSGYEGPGPDGWQIQQN